MTKSPSKVRIQKSKYDELVRKVDSLKRNLELTMHAQARNEINKKIRRINLLLEHCEIVL